VDWHDIFSARQECGSECTDLFYAVIRSCFGSSVPKTRPNYVRKCLWVTKKLNGLKNMAMRATKKMKKSDHS
jgi:hypothetical protein